MTLSKKIIWIGLPAILMLAVYAFVTHHKITPLSQLWWGDVNVEDNVAAHGFDVVSYVDAPVVQGHAQFTTSYQGAKYYFSSQQNMTRFQAQPQSFVPQFGGYCAFAVSKGFTADIDPTAWARVDDKVYLFADKDVRQEWLAGIKDGSHDSTLLTAHANWQVAQ